HTKRKEPPLIHQTTAWKRRRKNINARQTLPTMPSGTGAQLRQIISCHAINSRNSSLYRRHHSPTRAFHQLHIRCFNITPFFQPYHTPSTQQPTHTHALLLHKTHSLTGSRSANRPFT